MACTLPRPTARFKRLGRIYVGERPRQRAGRLTTAARSRPCGTVGIEKGMPAVTTDQARHFTLHYNRWMRAFAWGLGLGPRRSGVTLSEDVLQARMGWGFAAHIPR